MAHDVYQAVTDKIIASIEAGAAPWRKPWSSLGANALPLRANGVPYQGVNVLVLWSEAITKGYKAPRWLTFNQAKKLGGHVRKGEHGTQIVFMKRITKKREADDDETKKQSTFGLLRFYTVFNAEQCEGLPDRFYAKPAIVNANEKIEACEAYFKNVGASVSHGGDQAYYSPTIDAIRMPPLPAFENSVAYYGTLAHEVTHWTGHNSRLDRDLSSRFGSASYAAEELIAELGAAFICATLGIENEPRADHANYLASWLTMMKADKKAIFSAASLATKAADFCNARQPDYQHTDDDTDDAIAVAA